MDTYNYDVSAVQIYSGIIKMVVFNRELVHSESKIQFNFLYLFTDQCHKFVSSLDRTKLQLHHTQRYTDTTPITQS